MEKSQNAVLTHGVGSLFFFFLKTIHINTIPNIRYDITLSFPSFPILKSSGLFAGLSGTIVYCVLVIFLKQGFFKQRINGPKLCTQLYNIAGKRAVVEMND